MKMIWLPETDSTNAEAVRNIPTAEDMDVWFAEFQTAGRGQRGNKWESVKGMNLTFSILFKPVNILAVSQFVISQMVTVGIVDYLKRKNLDARIKWPNDIYVGDRKICGILIENTISGDKLSASVVGIGLNLNQREFQSDAPNPTSVVLELERHYSFRALDFDLKGEMELLLSDIFRKYGEVCADEDYSELEDRYHSLLYRLGKFHSFEELNPNGTVAHGRISARILGVDKKTARLQLELKNGSIKEYSFKEIKYLI